MNRKKILIGLTVIALLSSSVTLMVVTQADNSSIWDDEPKIHWNGSPLTAWWLKGYEEVLPNGLWIPAADALNDVYTNRSSELVNDNLVSIFVNDRNNTIFVGLKQLDSKNKNDILDIMNPSKDVSVKFKKGVASLVELNTWQEVISSKKKMLKELNVNILSSIKTVNGTILLGIDDLNIEKVNTLKEVLKNEVPLGVIEIYNEIPAVLEANQFDKHRPLIAGIELKIRNSTQQWAEGTIGFIVSWDDVDKHGVLTAAHVAQHLDSDGYQGGTSSGYKFGDTVELAEGPYSDSALIEFDSGIFGNPHLWDTSDLMRITGRRDYDALYQGQTVKKLGKSTGLQTGTILGKGDCTHPLYGDLENQVFVDISSANGDSGAPYFLEFWLSGKKHYWACGIHWGTYGSNRVFSPLDGIETDFEFELCFTGPWVDSFGDNRKDACTWEHVWDNSGVSVETQKKLQLNINPRPDPGVQSIAGYVTKDAHLIEDHSIEIDVSEFNSIDEMIIMICKTKITDGDPYFEDDWYRCLRTRYEPIGDKWYVQRRLDGGDCENLRIRDITTFTGKLKISVDEGTIYFYDVENDLQHYCDYELSGDIYFYIFTSTHTSRHTGTDYMDNWKYQSLD